MVYVEFDEIEFDLLDHAKFDLGLDLLLVSLIIS